jgi:hypothetical protein
LGHTTRGNGGAFGDGENDIPHVPARVGCPLPWETPPA